MRHQSDCSLYDFVVVNQILDLFGDTIFISIPQIYRSNEKS